MDSFLVEILTKQKKKWLRVLKGSKVTKSDVNIGAPKCYVPIL
jgi:hypothetical protein